MSPHVARLPNFATMLVIDPSGHMSITSATATFLIYTVFMLLHPSLVAMIQEQVSGRRTMRILLSVTACIAMLLLAVWIEFSIAARSAYLLDHCTDQIALMTSTFR